MLTEKQVRKLLVKVFEEEALVLGGMAAMREIDDALLCRLVANLQTISEKTIRRLDSLEPAHSVGKLRVTPHPAINLFLLKLKRIAESTDA